MGGIVSRSSSGSDKEKNGGSARTEGFEETNARVVSMLAMKKGEVDKSGHTMTFEKALFAEKAGDSTGLQFDGLQKALEVLHGPMEKQQVANLFDFVDIDDSKEIEYKEFLVALTTGHVLGSISTAEGFDDKAKIRLQNGLETTNQEIKNVLNLIVSAYLLFDPRGTGIIERDSVSNLIAEGKGLDKNAMLSKERWDEMVIHHVM